jgi:hypothetical protein
VASATPESPEFLERVTSEFLEPAIARFDRFGAIATARGDSDTQLTVMDADGYPLRH